MSGRKASEVNTLLRNAVKTRTNSMDILNDLHNKMINSSKEAEKKATDLKAELKNGAFEICEEAKKEFSQNANQLLDQLDRLKEKVEKAPFEVNDDEYDELLKEYSDVDKAADKVRREVSDKIRSQGRSDPWYCDDEFAHARQVQDRYKKLGEKTQKLKADMSLSASSINSGISAIEENAKQAEKLKSMIKNLNQKAKDLVKLRAEAYKAREEIQNEMNSINVAIAEKFMKEEFGKIKTKSETFLSSPDENVVKDFASVTSEITSFTNSLQVVYADYLERRSVARAGIESIEKRINNKVFSNPQDEFKKGDKEKLSLVGFLSKYGKSEETIAIIEEISRCRKMYDEDDFEGVNHLLKSIVEMVNNASNMASLIHENKMKTIFNMLTIQKVMVELNYDVDVRENSDLEDGYCITCKAGDECITFDKVTVVDDGQPVITIDHKEATNGTCAASWYDIRKRCSDEGLFIEDITKNGRSIHNIETKHRKSGETNGVLKGSY